ncbi:hypothetical protein PLICRDRAFT_35606 [Plicaturopsis crispa FD-325 SS-3]|nr:hypothetical protein PLICRDRAFT_35606 [Plicaturopsis crispa FD-325 SS-3]
MTAQTLEQKKAHYSHDLAQHTLRQWNIMREALEKQEREGEANEGRTADEPPRDGEDKESNPRTPRNANGVHVIDYAQISPNYGGRRGATGLNVR